MGTVHALSQAHMRRQVTQAATIQAALAVAYDRTLDPTNLDRSFAEFSRYSLPLIMAGRDLGIATADTYYTSAKAASRLGKKTPSVKPRPLNLERAVTSLRVVGPVNAKSKIARGTPVNQAMTAAKAATLGSAKRLILEAPRLFLIDSTVADSDARGWARVSDGQPCAFCAMLVSRGPVYSETSGDFEAHDKCGCSVMAVFRNDPTGGWTDGSRALHDLWNSAPDLSAFRTNYAESLTGDSLPETLAATAEAAA